MTDSRGMPLDFSLGAKLPREVGPCCSSEPPPAARTMMISEKNTLWTHHVADLSMEHFHIKGSILLEKSFGIQYNSIG